MSFSLCSSLTCGWVFVVCRFHGDDARTRLPSTNLHGELPDSEFSFGSRDPLVACQEVTHIYISHVHIRNDTTV